MTNAVATIAVDGGSPARNLRVGELGVLYLGQGAPSWSPDGRSLLFAQLGPLVQEPNVYPPRGPEGLAIMGLNGESLGFLQPLPAPNDYLYYRSADWAPNGKRIAFSFSSGSTLDPPQAKGLYVTNPDGTNTIQLAGSLEIDSDVVWSPDGSMLAFSGERLAPEGPPRLWVINADGSGLRALPIPQVPINPNAEISWAPPLKGPLFQECVVPELKGQKLSIAKTELKSSRCRVGKVTQRTSSRRVRGRVISQSPKAGKRVSAGSRVTLVVGR